MVNPNDVPMPKLCDYKIPESEQVSPEMYRYIFSCGEWHGRRMSFDDGRQLGAGEALRGMLVLAGGCVAGVVLWELVRWM